MELWINSKKSEYPSSGWKLSAKFLDYAEVPKVKSIRRQSSELGNSLSTLHRILSEDLHLYPYIIQIKHKVTVTEMQKCIGMCLWFQSHIKLPMSKSTLEWLYQRFSDRLISRRRDTEWSPLLPDLSPPDFYMWGLLKDRVHGNNPKTIVELKLAITQSICAIKRKECARVADSFACQL